MPEIQSLKRVSLREAWPHEAHDSVPWPTHPNPHRTHAP